MIAMAITTRISSKVMNNILTGAFFMTMISIKFTKIRTPNTTKIIPEYLSMKLVGVGVGVGEGVGVGLGPGPGEPLHGTVAHGMVKLVGSKVQHDLQSELRSILAASLGL